MQERNPRRNSIVSMRFLLKIFSKQRHSLFPNSMSSSQVLLLCKFRQLIDSLRKRIHKAQTDFLIFIQLRISRLNLMMLLSIMTKRLLNSDILMIMEAKLPISKLILLTLAISRIKAKECQLS